MNDFTRELAKIAEQKQRDNDLAERRARREREDRERAEAMEAVKDLTLDLKDRMWEAAKEGKRELLLVSSSWGYFNSEQRKLARGYTIWAIQNGISSFWDSLPGSGSDGTATEWMGLRW